MRASSLAALLTVAATAALVSGCTPQPDALSPTPTAAESATPVDVCALAAPPGAASQAVIVDGSVGSAPTATFPLPLSVTALERTVVVEGDGEPLDNSALVEYGMTVFDAATGQQVQTEGYGGGPTLPVAAMTVGQYLGCATVGSRVAVAVPETDQGAATVWVLDVLGAIPGRATGADQPAVEGMPTVELADDGAPAISVRQEAPPTETTVAVLKKGDGASVAPGDTVMVHYTGVRWSDGSVFDSSWDKGAPTALVTTDVIEGYREALEGQTVGSQVLVAIPPRAAYGEGEINEEDLTGETLVFVVDVLATTPAA